MASRPLFSILRMALMAQSCVMGTINCALAAIVRSGMNYSNKHGLSGRKPPGRFYRLLAILSISLLVMTTAQLPAWSGSYVASAATRGPTSARAGGVSTDGAVLPADVGKGPTDPPPAPAPDGSTP